MRSYFGVNFGPVCDDLPHIDTPVGSVCLYCEDLIDQDDDGLITPFFDAATNQHWGAIHKECNLRSVMGGISHLERRCSCYGGSSHDEDDGMTPRESALAVWAWVQEHGIPA